MNKDNIKKYNTRNKGNTLIETLIYITLLGILIIGVFSSIYMIIDLEERKNEKNYSIILLKQII